MQQVNSIKDIEAALDENKELIVSKNDENNIIVMSIEEYTNNTISEETIKALIESEEDIEEDRVKEAKEVFKEWKEKYAL